MTTILELIQYTFLEIKNPIKKFLWIEHVEVPRDAAFRFVVFIFISFLLILSSSLFDCTLAPSLSSITWEIDTIIQHVRNYLIVKWTFKCYFFTGLLKWPCNSYIWFSINWGLNEVDLWAINQQISYVVLQLHNTNSQGESKRPWSVLNTLKLFPLSHIPSSLSKRLSSRDNGAWDMNFLPGL